MKRKPEILAPVGSEDALIAAVRSGADAVYFGTGECNARRNAGKFEGDALLQAVRYCHARDVAVYLTVNTLLRDEELQTAADTLEQIALSGADGIILQDLAIAHLAKQICPALPLHASTQMAIHNAAGVRQLCDMGFSRVVLARELSGREIEKIKEQTNTELEVFVHGALCMSASGMCYLSASLGERSGNRGTCAQPCRLPFSCNGAQNCLSLKDMSHLSYLQKLAEIGVSSCKIEGRMKRPEYVAAAVSAAVKARDGEPYETDTLRSVFSRSGFTDGYYMGKRNHTMFGVRTNEDAERSKQVLASFRELYRTERRSVPIQADMTIQSDLPTALTITDGIHTVQEKGFLPESAIHAPLTRYKLLQSLSKTGGTPFYLDELRCDLDDGLTVPASEINRLRRDALEKLLALREQTPKREVQHITVDCDAQGRRCETPKLFVRFAAAEQFFTDERIDACSLPTESLIVHPEWIAPRVMTELPELCYPMEEDKLKEQLMELIRLGVRDAVVGNLGMLRIAKEVGMRLHGGYGLNLTNQIAVAEAAELGLSDVLLSFELPFAKMRDLKSSVPCGCIVAGRLPLMQLRSCPARTDTGCGKCDGKPVITDRTGRIFPLVCHQRRYTTMLNSVPLYTADKRLPSLDFYVLYLTTETRQEAIELLDRIDKKEKPLGEHTTGMSFRTLL